METIWKVLSCLLALVCLQLCDGLPLDLDRTYADGHTQFLTGLIAILLTICGVVCLAGCLCCQRRNGFKEFRDSPVTVSVANNLDHGHVNPIANGEFTIFTPLSPPLQNNNVFLANQQVITRNEEDFKTGDIDVSRWFDPNEKDFPRTRLKYIKEFGKGWFGRVVEGTAQGLEEDDNIWTPVVVRILETTATSRQRVLFLHDASIYKCSPHPNLLKLLGRCLESIPLLLLQESCTKGDLKKYLREQAPTKDTFLGSDLPLRWCYQLTSALKHLHSSNITHPDLATRNCQLSDDLHLKLGDYGCSMSDYPEDYYNGTENVPIRWCAPESVSYTATTLQTTNVTKGSNIWSLGVCLWEIYESGAQPYTSLTDDEVVSQVLGSPNIRLSKPSFTVLYTDYIYKLMQMCWLTFESRPQILQIELMLADLVQVHENTKNRKPNTPPIVLDDFDNRWEMLKPNDIVKTDNHPVEIIEPDNDLTNITVLNMNMRSDQDSKKLSASLHNLAGSFDNLLEKGPMDSWEADDSFTRVIRDLDTALASENMSSSDSSPRPSQGMKLQFKLGPNSGDPLMRTSSESETEDETWKKKIERGAYTEKVRQKSRSVADLMILTHIDCSESDSETPLPSLDYRFSYRNVRYAPKNNLENVSLTFGSEGNLLNVQDTFQEELRKLQEERRDSLLFVPEKETQLKTNSNSPAKKLMEDLNSPATLEPQNQIFNVYNVVTITPTISPKVSPIHKKELKKLIEYQNVEEMENISVLPDLVLNTIEYKRDIPKLSEIIENNIELMDYIITKHDSNPETLHRIPNEGVTNGFDVVGDKNFINRNKVINDTNVIGYLTNGHLSSEENLDNVGLTEDEAVDKRQSCQNSKHFKTLHNIHNHENSITMCNGLSSSDNKNIPDCVPNKTTHIDVIPNGLPSSLHETMRRETFVKEIVPTEVPVKSSLKNVKDSESLINNHEFKMKEVVDSASVYDDENNVCVMNGVKSVATNKQLQAVHDFIQEEIKGNQCILTEVSAKDESKVSEEKEIKIKDTLIASEEVRTDNDVCLKVKANNVIITNTLAETEKDVLKASTSLNSDNLSRIDKDAETGKDNLLTGDAVIEKCLISEHLEKDNAPKNCDKEENMQSQETLPIEKNDDMVPMEEILGIEIEVSVQNSNSNDVDSEELETKVIESAPNLSSLQENMTDNGNVTKVKFENIDEVMKLAGTGENFNSSMLKNVADVSINNSESNVLKDIENKNLFNETEVQKQDENIILEVQNILLDSQDFSVDDTYSESTLNEKSNIEYEISTSFITNEENVFEQPTENFNATETYIKPLENVILEKQELPNLTAEVTDITEITSTKSNRTIIVKTQDFINNEIVKYEDSSLYAKPKFDLSEHQEEIAPNSLTHSILTSTPFKRQENSVILGASDDYSIDFYSGLKTTTDEEKEAFSSNFIQVGEKTGRPSELRYSLETWDNFLGRSFDEQHEYDSYSSEPQSMIFLDNQVESANYVEDTNASKEQNGTFIVEKVEEDNVVDINDIILTVEDENGEKEGYDNPGYWENENVGGWFLHPQVNSDELSGQMDVSEDDSYVGFSMDDEVMAAIRNELLTKLPQAQRASSEHVEEGEEYETTDRNEVFVRYNCYNTPLSPIPEESYSELLHSGQSTPHCTINTDLGDADSDWSEPGIDPNLTLDEDTHSPRMPESPHKGPTNRNTPSQDSCCSNDTLFNLEDLQYIEKILEQTDKTPENSESEQLNETIVIVPAKKDLIEVVDVSKEMELVDGSLPSSTDNTTLKYEEQTVVDDAVETLMPVDLDDSKEDLAEDENNQETLEIMSEEEILEDATQPTIIINEEVSPSCDIETTKFLEKERNFSSQEINLSMPNKKENEESSSGSETYLTVSDGFAVPNVAPLNSPEDRPWKHIEASLSRCPPEVPETTMNIEYVETELTKNEDYPNEYENIEEMNIKNSLVSQQAPEYVNMQGSPSDDIYDCIDESKSSTKVDYVNQVPTYVDDVKEEVPVYVNELPVYVNCDGNAASVAEYANTEPAVMYENCNYEAYLNLMNEDPELEYDNLDSRGSVDDVYGPLTDIRFTGPTDSQMMTTSFSDSNDLGDEQDWDSGSDTRSSSSGEFIWKEGEHEASVKALHAAPQDTELPQDEPTPEEESSSGSEEDIDGPEFVPSAWDKYATPTKSALRSPEKSLDRPPKKLRGVSFKKQKYHCVYEYPREPDSPVVQPYDIWQDPPAIDWDVDRDSEQFLPGASSDIENTNDIISNTLQIPSRPHRNLFQTCNVPDFLGSSILDDDFYISSSAKPFDMFNTPTSQFFPGRHCDWSELIKNNDNVTPDSGVEDITPGSLSDSSEYLRPSRQILPLKTLAQLAINKGANMGSNEIGGMRHTRNRLKLDLPTSPSAFTKTFSVEPTIDAVARQMPTFTTFGKSRFVVQQVDTPTDDAQNKKNVSFEALPYKPLTTHIYKDDPSVEKHSDKHRVEIVRGEASLLDSADEDSGIESCTLERKRVS